MNSKRLLLPLAGLMTLLTTLLGACNKDSSDTPYYVEPSSVAVSGFSLKANSKVLTGLDSVFFSIDLERGLIFNADSLPKGTRVDALIPIISLPGSVAKAQITMEGGQKKTGTVDYLKNMEDSIDFSGRVTLELASSEGNSRLYQIKVNVHQVEPDSLWWGSTALAKLPSRMGDPLEQRTVQTGDGSAAALIREKDGSYTFSSSADVFGGVWSKTAVGLPFSPDVRSLTFCNSQFYLLSATGSLYASADGTGSWQPVSEGWKSIVGAYGDTLLGIAADDANPLQYSFVSLPEGVAAGPVPDGFPLQGASDMLVLTSKWWQTPYAILYGGSDTRTDTSKGAVWAFDGSRWSSISNGGLPALTGAAMVPYFAYRRADKSWMFTEYSVLLIMGGRLADGTPNHDIYMSYDNGVFWQKAPELMQMPDYIPGMYDMDAMAATTTLSGNFEPKGWTTAPSSSLPAWYKASYTTDGYNINWDCPYIYLYGGRDSAGRLSDSVWRGVIRRLTFTPLL